MSAAARRSLIAIAAVLLLAPPASAQAGTIVADNGFRPDPDGFSFANYGDEEGYADLDALEMQRLFGPAVCVAGRGGRCVLTPTARLWMESMNREMAGGHCFGFATLAELIHDGRLPRFGYRSLSIFRPGAERTFALGIGSVRLQRSIARAFTYQVLPAVSERSVEGTPVRILGFLRRALNDARGEEWTMTIFQRGFEGGHAITPYAIEDMGGGIYDVHVYDNNWPDDDSRRLRIDANRNTWSYYAAINPGIPAAEYEGDAKTKTLGLAPTRPGLGTHPCTFCVGRQGVGSKHNEVRLEGSADRHARVVIVDSEGRRAGIVGGRLVNEIPGAKIVPRTSAGPRPTAGGGAEYGDSPVPVFKIPRHIAFTVRIDGRDLRVRDRETLTVVGPTYDATVENIVMGPGQTAAVRLSPRGRVLSYRSSKATRTPTVALGAESRRTASRVSVSAVGAPRGAGLVFAERPGRQLMRIADGTDAKRRYRLTIERASVRDEASFARTFTIRGKQRAYLYHASLARPDGVPKIVIYGPQRRKLRVLPVPIRMGRASFVP